MSKKQSPDIEVGPGDSSSLTSSPPPPRVHEGHLPVDLDSETQEELRSPGKKK